MVNWKFWSNENNSNNYNESSPLLNNNNKQNEQQQQQQQQQQNGEEIIVDSNNNNYNIPLSVSSIGFLRNRQQLSSSSGISKSSSNIPISQSMDSISMNNNNNNNIVQGPLYEETPLTFSSFLNKLNKKNQSVQHIGNNDENDDDYSIPSNSSLSSPNLSSNNNNNNNNNNGDSFNSNNNNNSYNNDNYNNFNNGIGNEKQSKKEFIKDKLKIIKKRVPYYIPILGWLPKYNREKAIGDVTAGITTAIMLVPQSLAYALLVGVPPIYGLYTGCLPLLIYAITGTCAQISLGPEALVSLIVGTTLKEISDNADVPLTSDEMIASANILCFLVGIISLILGLLRFGFLSEVLSRPLIRGFINAVACTILIDQLDKLLGVSIGSGESGWRKLPTIFKHWSEVNELSLIISVVSIVSLVVMGQIKKRCCPEKRTKIIHHIIFFIPSILVVVVVGISVSAGFKLKDKGIAVLGYYPSSFPVPTLPKLNRWELVNQLLGPAFFVSIVGFVETISIAKNFATKHNYQVSTNRELVAIGTSNIFGSIFLCFPIFASMSRSAVNDKAGAKTQLAGAVTFVVVLFTLLFLLPIFQYLPISIMSSIIFVAAMGLFEVHDIIFLWKLRAWIDLLLFSATFICTFIFSVEVGLVVSIGASILLVIRQSSAPHFTVLGKLPGEPQSTKFKDIIIFPEAQQVDGVLVIRFEESLYFANIGQVKEILFRIETIGNALAHPSEMLSLPEGQRSQLFGIVFDMRNIPVIDASSTQILYEMVEQYKKRSIQVCFVKLRDSHKKNFIRAGFIDLIGTDSFFSSTNDAVNKIKSNSILVRSNSNQTFTPNIPSNLKNSFSYSSYIYKSNHDSDNNNQTNSNNNSGCNTPTLINNQNSPTNSNHNLLSISQYYNSILDDNNDNNSSNSNTTTTTTTTTNDILVNAIVENNNNNNNIDNNYNI